MPSISEMLLKEKPLEAMLAALYGELEYTILAESPLAFECDCSKERFSEGLQSLGSQALTEIIEEDHGAEVLCQFCGRKYEFTEKELNDLILGAAQK